MNSLLDKLANLVFENSCLICNEGCGKAIVCKACEKDFIVREENYIKHFEEIKIFSWGFYSNRLRDGIIALKNSKKQLANYFAEKIATFWGKVTCEIKNKDYLVIPTPSHKKRIKERGYCQVDLIASDFAKKINLRFVSDFVIRRKETLYMNNLANINERVKNIKNAFEVVGTINNYENILIIDDLVTSGSTMRELARTIYKKFPNTNLLGLTIASGDTYPTL